MMGPARLEARAFVDGLADRMLEEVCAIDTRPPLEAGMPMATLRSALVSEEAVAALALAQLIAAGALEAGGGGVRRHGWVPVMGEAVILERDWILDRLRASGGEPPTVSDLRSERGGNDPVPVLRILERERLVVQVEGDRYYEVDTLDRLIARLRHGMVPGQVYGPAELREIIGTSRKYLIPLLEYCDRQRITERRPEGRVLGS